MFVKNKEQMYALWQAGAFGNKPRSWLSVDEFLADDYRGTVSVRYKGCQGGGKAQYNVAYAEVPAVVEEWLRDPSVERERITINESAPDEQLVLQGEVYRGFRGLELRYSTLQGKMRDCLAEQSLRLTGFAAHALLKRHMSPASWADFQELLDLYAGDESESATIEFGIYDIEVGDCRGRNTIIWEVRNY